MAPMAMSPPMVDGGVNSKSRGSTKNAAASEGFGGEARSSEPAATRLQAHRDNRSTHRRELSVHEHDDKRNNGNHEHHDAHDGADEPRARPTRALTHRLLCARELFHLNGLLLALRPVRLEARGNRLGNLGMSMDIVRLVNERLGFRRLLAGVLGSLLPRGAPFPCRRSLPSACAGAPLRHPSPRGRCCAPRLRRSSPRGTPASHRP